MKGELRVEKTATLHLNEKEIEWLKALVQNPMDEQEDEQSARIRASIWNILNQDNPNLQIKSITDIIM